jgi:hypothetical protein
MTYKLLIDSVFPVVFALDFSLPGCLFWLILPMERRSPPSNFFKTPFILSLPTERSSQPIQDIFNQVGIMSLGDGFLIHLEHLYAGQVPVA